MPEKPVANAAATQEDTLGSGGPTGDESTQGACNHAGDKMRRGTHQIVKRARGLLRHLHGLGNEFIRNVLTWSALGRTSLQVGMIEPALKQAFHAVSLHPVF